MNMLPALPRAECTPPPPLPSAHTWGQEAAPKAGGPDAHGACARLTQPPSPLEGVAVKLESGCTVLTLLQLSS